jgi:hypothetical protein
MARTKAAIAEVIAIGGQVPTNGGEDSILAGEPYIATVRIKGVANYLYHGWNVESVAAKASAKKGSAAKKSDDLESYVYRDDAGYLAIPGEQIRMSIIHAAKYLQDPRSPRKSAMDLFKAGLVVLTEMGSVGPKPKKEWDFVDQRRVVVQRNAITRSRPALEVGWEAEWDIQVLLPEYISPALLNETITKAGMFCALGDFRPTYGRFQITNFKVR